MARPNMYPTRRWWVNSAKHWFVGGKDYLSDEWPHRKLRTPIRLFFRYSLELDWNSIDLSLWLGWFGFRLYYLVESWQYWGQLVSGATLMYGRTTFHDGGQYCHHIRTLEHLHSEPLQRQVTINGQQVIVEKDGSVRL